MQSYPLKSDLGIPLQKENSYEAQCLVITYSKICHK